MEPVQFLATSGFHFFLCLTGLAWTQRQPPRIPWNITTIIYFIINRYKLGSITLQHHHDHWRKPRREEGKSNSRFNNFPIVLSNSVPHQSANETLINDIYTPPLQFCFWQKLNAFSGVYAGQNRQSGSHPLFKWNIFIFMCSPLEYDMYSYLTVVAAQSHILRGMMNYKDRLLDIMTTFGDRTEERPGKQRGGF